MSMDPSLRKLAVEAIKEAALEAFDGQIRSILLRGSAIRADFIPGYSDLDIHIYVPSSHMQSGREPRLENAIRFQRAVGGLVPGDFGVSSFQIFFIDAECFPGDWSKPLKGTYELIYGGPVDDAVPPEEHLEKSRKHLETIPKYVATLIERFVDKPDTALPAFVRLSGVFLKGAVYSASTVVANDPEVVIDKSVSNLLDLLEDGGVFIEPARDFFSRLEAWDELTQDPELCREAFGLAIRGMQNINEWFAATSRVDP